MRDAAFAERLKNMRTSCRLTQQKMATALGIERSTYAYYETGKTFPDILTLARIAGIFHVTTDDLLGLPGVTRLADDSFSFADMVGERFAQLSEDEQMLLLQFRAMTDTERQELLQFLSDQLPK